MSVTIRQGSILDSDADYIVNPANNHLRHGAGLAKVIADAATRNRQKPASDGIYHTAQRTDLYYKDARAAQEWHREQRAHPLIPTGGAGLTGPGALPYKGIIHAVGPVWGGGDYEEAKLLGQAHYAAIGVARAMGGTSIAIPAISCGLFGYPVELAAPIAVACGTVAHDLDVEFWLFSDDHYQAYAAAHAGKD